MDIVPVVFVNNLTDVSALQDVHFGEMVRLNACTNSRSFKAVWGGVHEDVVVSDPIQKFCEFYGTRWYITVFITARYVFLLRAR